MLGGGAAIKSASPVSELTAMHAGSIFALPRDSDLDLGVFRIELMTPFVGAVVVSWWSVPGPTYGPQRPASANVIFAFDFGITPLPLPLVVGFSFDEFRTAEVYFDRDAKCKP